jgi:hypothetical protein
MEIVVGLLLGCGTPVLLIYVAVVAVRWVLGPLDRAAKNRRYPIQFTLADFLCLFVQVQLALAGPALAFRQMDNRNSAIIGASVIVAIIVALVLLVWWTGVRTLSRAGVHGTLARALTLTVAIPFGYACSIAIPGLAIGLIGVLFGGPPREYSWAVVLLPVEMVLILIVVGLGFMTRHFLASAEPQPEKIPLQVILLDEHVSTPSPQSSSETQEPR